jgi:hypothetical protein
MFMRLVTMIVFSLVLTGCCKHNGRQTIALIDTPQVQGMRISHGVRGKTEGTLMRAGYDRGAKLNIAFLGTEVEIEDTASPSGDLSSGVILKSGTAHVNATLLPSVSSYQASGVLAWRFWPIIRTRRVTVGAEGTTFIVEAFDPPLVVNNESMVARVYKVSGSSVLIDYPQLRDVIKLIRNRMYAEIFVKSDGSYYSNQYENYNAVPVLRDFVRKTIDDADDLDGDTPGQQSP